jgi:hypothetical protein
MNGNAGAWDVPLDCVASLAMTETLLLGAQTGVRAIARSFGRLARRLEIREKAPQQ